jgi:branched-chain amino acid transport system substrate-binding protein
MNFRALATLAAAAALIAVSIGAASAQKRYDTGATDTEIKIGNIMPYSGPASAYGLIGKTEDAYFRMINDQGDVQELTRRQQMPYTYGSVSGPQDFYFLR